jgi:hypothetical protein
MKMFNKVLAVILSVIMLLTAIPVMAFASGTSGNSSGSSSSAESLPVTLTIPDPAGTGADGTITIRLNAADVVAALKSEKSLDTLIGLFKDMVEVSNTDIVTVNDLLELVPVEEQEAVFAQHFAKTTKIITAVKSTYGVGVLVALFG